MATHYRLGDGVPRDYQKARQLDEAAVAQGEPYAQAALAAMYFAGLGVRADPVKGLKLLRAAAAQGYKGAESLLGLFTLNGIFGVSRNFQEAVRLFRLAAEQRDTDSQLVLGTILSDPDDGVRRDVEATMWLLLASRTGCSEAARLATAARQTLPPFRYLAAVIAVDEWERAHPAQRHNHSSGLPRTCFGAAGKGA